MGVRLAMDPDLEICERGIRRGPGSWMQRDGYRSDGPGPCSRGTALAVFELRDGAIEAMELEPWTGSVPAGVRDGGAPGPDEAAALALAASRELAGTDDGGVAMMTAVHLDGPPVWPGLLELARDRGVPERGRKSALFWLGQEAADAVTEGILQVAGDDSEEQGIRDAAVFALSQRPDDEAVPALIELARTARHGKTRRSAMFWLAQSEDPRVTAFFEEVLVGGSSGRR